MVAIFTGQVTGFERGSGNVLGAAGLIGTATSGRSGQQLLVNAATGNLMVQRQDTMLVGVGPDAAVQHTYNSLGSRDDIGGDNWRVGGERRLDVSTRLAGYVTLHTDDGSTIVFRETSAGSDLFRTTEGSGSYDTVTRTGSNWVLRDGDTGMSEEYGYGTLGDRRITKRTDRSGNSIAFAWNSASLLQSITTSDGGSITYGYSGSSANATTATVAFADPLTGASRSHVYRYAYDASGRLSGTTIDLTPDDGSIVDGKAYSVSYLYNNAGLIREITETDGSRLTIDYDASNRVTTLSQHMGSTAPMSSSVRTTSLSYGNGATTITDPQGRVTTLRYNSDGSLASVTTPASGEWAQGEQVTSFTYTANGDVASTTDPLGRTTSFTFDANGNSLTGTDRLGNVVTRTFDADNRLRTETRTGSDQGSAAAAHTDRYVYDAAGRLRFTISAAGNVTEQRYDARGQVETSIVYTFERYPIDSLSSTSVPSEADLEAWAQAVPYNPRVRESHFAYDVRGNLRYQTDYSTFDGFGLTTFNYDQAGRLIRRAKTGENAESFVYDGMGRLVASTDLNGGTTSIVFDDAATRTVVTLANGLTQTSVYDLAGGLVSYTEAGAFVPTGTVTYRNDALGRPRVTTDANGIVSYQVWDRAGRKAADVSQTGELIEYRYDMNDRLVATARFANRINPALFPALDYPDTNLIAGNLRPTVDEADLWTWQIYDAEDRVIQTIDGSGSAVSYGYDASGRLVSTTEHANRVSESDTTYFKFIFPTVPVSIAPSASDRVTRTFYDADGRAVGALDGEGFLSRNGYDGAGTLIEETRFGTRVPADTAAGGTPRASGTFAQLLELADPLSEPLPPGAPARNRTMRYVYDGQGFLRFEIDPLGQVVEYDYSTSVMASATGRVRKATAHATAIGPQASYTLHAVHAALDAAGADSNPSNRVSFSVYDAADREVYAIGPDGAVEAYRYDIMGQRVATTAFATKRPTVDIPLQAEMDGWAAANADAGQDRTTRRYFAANGDLRFVVDAEGHVTRSDYDAGGRLVAELRFAAKVMVDDTTTTAALEAMATGAYVANTYSYDAMDRLAASSDGNGTSTSYSYGANGLRMVEVVAPGTVDEARTTYRYDAAGRVLERLDAQGSAEEIASTFAYNAFGELVASVDARGAATSYALDQLGRTVAVTDAAGTTGFAYNAFGDQIAVTDARGSTTTNYFDAAGRRIASVDGENYVTRYAYNSFDELASTTRFAGRQVPGAGALPKGAGPAAVTNFTYDKLGRLVSTTDAEGYSELTGYDAFGNVTSVQNKVGGVTRYSYDRRGLQLTEYVDAPVHDAHGQQVAPGYFRHVYSYDARGNRLSDVEAQGLAEQRVTTFTYDAANRLLSRSGDVVAVGAPGAVQNIAPTETYAYDARGNVVLTVDATGFRTQSYHDDLNRVVAEVRSIGGPSPTQGVLTTYGYDANGNLLLSRTYEHPLALPAVGGAVPSAPATGGYRETGHAYDALNRRTSTTTQAVRTGAWNGTEYTTTVAPIVSTREYDANGNVVRKTDGNGASVITYYDRLNRAVGRVDANRYVTSWTRDAEGNVLTETRWANLPELATFESPPVVTANPEHDRVTSFTYDKNGRRLTETRHDVQAWTVDPATGALTATTGPATVSYAYNGLGEVTRRTEATGDHVEYSYDGQGRLTHEARAAFTDQTGATVRPTVDYLYNGLGDLSRTVESGARITSYVYGAGGRLLSSTDAAGGSKGYFHDAAGRKLAETYDRIDSAGNVRHEATTFTFDDVGQMTSQGHAAFHPDQGWVAAGDMTTMHYNSYGEVVARAVNGVMQERFEYDAAGRLWRTNTDDGVYRVYLYDGAGNRTMAIQADGADLSTLTLDEVLALTSDQGSVPIGQSTTAGARTSFTVYDRRGASVSTIASRQYYEQATATYGDLTDWRTYNAFGEQVSQTDVLGNVTTYHYNTAGRRTVATLPLVDVTNEAGATTQVNPTQHYYYDISGRLIGTADANGNTITRSLVAGTGYGEAEALIAAEWHPDGGVIRNGYDVFGDMRTVTDEVSQVTTMTYDGLGRLTASTGPDTYTDSYTYDVLGQRIRHMNSAFVPDADGFVEYESTDYDAQGRVVSTRLFGGDTTTTDYIWDPTLTVQFLGTQGGYRETTSFANGRSSEEIMDGFDHMIARTDLGGHSYQFTYDTGGKIISEAVGNDSRRYRYYRSGMALEVVLQRGLGTIAGDSKLTTAYAYDQRGLKTREYTAERTVVTFTQSDGFQNLGEINDVLQDATATYDALGRMVTWNDTIDRDAVVDTPANSISYLYDAVGNIRRADITYNNVDDNGNFVPGGRQDQWFRYDAMNRVVTAKGALVDGQIVRGDTGTDITYDAAGRRATATTTVKGQDRRETYVQNPEGQLSTVTVEALAADGSATLLTQSGFAYDAFGRVQTQQDQDQTGQVYFRHVNYNAKGQATSETVSVRRGTDTIVTQTNTGYGEGAAYALGAPVLSTSSTTVNNGTAVVSDTAYTYEYFDSPLQATITYRADVNGAAPGNVTTQTYSGFGVLLSSQVSDGRPRTVKYQSNAQGQVIRRQESDNNAATGDPFELWFRFDGRELGRVGNNGTLETDYATSVADRGAVPGTGGAFRNGAATGVAVADWGAGYEPVTSYRQGSEGGTYTVRTGDTLQGIAERVYGDASLWYKIAQANGLGTNAPLVEGQVLALPRGVLRTANSASTFRPYDPSAVVGDIFPDEVAPQDTSATQPQPQVRRRRNRCGVFGAILLAVVAVAVTAIAGPAIVGFAQGAAGLGLGAGAGAVVGGALTGAAASVASQAVGLATGIQDRFSFRGVALAALAGGVGGALAPATPNGPFLGVGGAGGAALRGAAGSALSQGIGVVTGLQSRFDFAGVAAAGIGAGAEVLAGQAFGPGVSAPVRRIGVATAGGIAGAAAQSLINGDSFGDNLVAALPQIVARTVGGIIADARNARNAPGTMRARMAEAGADAGNLMRDGAGGMSSVTGGMGMANGTSMRVGGAGGVETIGEEVVVTAQSQTVRDVLSLTALEFYNIDTLARLQGLDAPAENARIRQFVSNRSNQGVGEVRPSGNSYTSRLLGPGFAERYGLNSILNPGYSYGGVDYISLDAAQRANPGMQFLNAAPSGTTSGTSRYLDRVQTGTFAGILYGTANALGASDFVQSAAYGFGLGLDAVLIGGALASRQAGPTIGPSRPLVTRQLERYAADSEVLVPLSRADVRAKIFGTGQQTGNDGAHAFRSYREAILLARNSEVEAVYLNTGYNAGLELAPRTISPNRRPDVLARYSDGRVDRVEVYSQTDNEALLRSRNTFLDPQIRANGYTPLPPRVVYPVRGR